MSQTLEVFEIAKVYHPSAEDVPTDIYHSRLGHCAECEHRRNQQCALDGVHCTVKARRAAGECHALKWSSSLPQNTPAVRRRPPAGVKAPRKTLRVVIVSPQLAFPGGAEQWMCSLARHLPWVPAGAGESRVIVSAVCVAAHDRIAEETAEELGQFCQIVSNNPHRGESARIASAMSAADVVIMWGMGDLRPLLSGVALSCPVVWVAHGQCHWTQRFIAEAAATGVVTHWAAVSHAARDVYPEKLRDQVIVLENGVEPARCVPSIGRDEQRRRWGLDSLAYVVLFLGRLHDDKNPEAMARAIALLPERYVGVYVGAGDSAGIMQQRCEALAPGRLKFPGATHHVGDALAAADVLFMASPNEGYCLARAEAWYARLPVVSTRTADIDRLEEEQGRLIFDLETTDPLEAANKIQFACLRSINPLHISRDFLDQITAPASALRWHRWLNEIASR